MRAVKKAKENSKPRNFTQSMEMGINLQGLDMKKTQNRIKEDFVLPNGRGKDVKIGVFASGDMALRAKRKTCLYLIKKTLKSFQKIKNLLKSRKFTRFFHSTNRLYGLSWKIIRPNFCT